MTRAKRQENVQRSLFLFSCHKSVKKSRMESSSTLKRRNILNLIAILLIVLIGCILTKLHNYPVDYLKAVSQPQDPGGPFSKNEDDIESGISKSEKEYGPDVQQRELKPFISANTLPCDGPECPYRQATLAGSRGYKGSYFPVEPIKNPETGGPVEDDEELVTKMINDMDKKPCIKLCLQLGVRLPQLAACSKDCRKLKREKVQALIGQLNRLRETNRCFPVVLFSLFLCVTAHLISKEPHDK